MLQEYQRKIAIHDRDDFVKSIHCENGYAILLYEKFHIQLYKNELTDLFTELWLETPVYDCRSINAQTLIVSSSKMPVRLYSTQKNSCIASITDKKQNSQSFLAPLSITKTNKENVFIGGGCKFVTIYDCETLKPSRMKMMDKTNVSALLCKNNNLIVGSFQGVLHSVDLRSNQCERKWKTHVDGVLEIVGYGDNHFISAGRKDNYRYLWDLRNLESFVTCYEDNVYGNQRIQMSIHEKNLFTGSENGAVKQYSLETGQLLRDHKIIENEVIPAIGHTNGKVVFGSGSRKFDNKPFFHEIGLLNY